MAEAQSDAPADTNNASDDKGTPTPPVQAPSLDQVHDETIAKLDNEGADDAGSDDEGSDDDKGEADKGSDDEGSEDKGAGEAGGDAGKGDDSDEDTDEDESEDEDDAADKPGTKPAVLNNDINQDGEGKIAIESADGETFYFNNIDEMPDDFEPANYKAYAKAVSKLTQKEISDDNARKSEEAEAAAAENQKAVTDLQTQWNGEIDKLVTAGTLPKDDKARSTIVAEVYNYMAQQVNNGVVIDSWEQGYKAYMYDKSETDRKKQSEQADKDKKRRGSMVTGGSTPPAAPRSGRPIEGPPAGVSLDQVHEHELSKL